MEPGWDKAMALCDACSKAEEQELVFHAFGLPSQHQLSWERVRVLSITPEWTTLRPLHSDKNGGRPGDWAVLTKRLSMPDIRVGDEVELGMDRDALDWLQGKT
jgi:hypothetical protein